MYVVAAAEILIMREMEVQHQPEITSIRIISVDHYQETPSSTLGDPCVSKLRGSEIKRVSIKKHLLN